MLINTSRIHIVLHSSSWRSRASFVLFSCKVDPILISFICNMGVKKNPDSMHTHTRCTIWYEYIYSGSMYTFLVLFRERGVPFFFVGLQTVWKASLKSELGFRQAGKASVHTRVSLTVIYLYLVVRYKFWIVSFFLANGLCCKIHACIAAWPGWSKF